MFCHQDEAARHTMPSGHAPLTCTTCHAVISPTPGPGPSRHRGMPDLPSRHPDARPRRDAPALHAVSRPARLAKHRSRARDHHDPERREPTDRVQQPPGSRRRQLRQCLGARHRRVRDLPHHDAALPGGRHRAAALHVLVPRLSPAQRRIHAVRYAWLAVLAAALALACGLPDLDPYRQRAASRPATRSRGVRGTRGVRRLPSRLGRELRQVPHAGPLDDPARPPDQRACEACHGAGQAHIDGGGGTAGNLNTFAASESEHPAIGAVSALPRQRIGPARVHPASTRAPMWLHRLSRSARGRRPIHDEDDRAASAADARLDLARPGDDGGALLQLPSAVRSLVRAARASQGARGRGVVRRLPPAAWDVRALAAPRPRAGDVLPLSR